MPISFSVDNSNELIRAEAVGAITRAEIERHLSEERRAGGISYRELIDATQATAAFDAADARSLIDTVRAIVRTTDFGPTAVIVADNMTYGMLRMLEILLEDVCDVRPFRPPERDAAELWVRRMPIRPRIEP
jgi:hypothetical protein